jgi:hypothetical protein
MLQLVQASEARPSRIFSKISGISKTARLWRRSVAERKRAKEAGSSISSTARAMRRKFGSTTPTPVRGSRLGVVSLLRERPGIAFHNHRQMHGDRFADAGRAGLADEAVGQLHVARHLAGEAFHEQRSAVRHARRASRAAFRCGRRRASVGDPGACPRCRASRTSLARRIIRVRPAGRDRNPARRALPSGRPAPAARSHRIGDSESSPKPGAPWPARAPFPPPAPRPVRTRKRCAAPAAPSRSAAGNRRDR